MVVSVAIDLALDRLFTYEVPHELEGKLAVGQLLSVPFGHRVSRGFVLACADRPAAPKSGEKPYVLKPIESIVDETPFFSQKLLDLVRLVAAYTASPVECVLRAALPAAVLKRNAHARELLYVEPVTSPAPPKLTERQRWLYDQIVRLGGGWVGPLCAELGTTSASLRLLAEKGLARVEVRAKRRDPLAGSRILPTKPLPLNPEQQSALTCILTSARPVLLFGITGSGKTEVYLQAIAHELDAGRGAIVMVPEISLTPQTVRRFASRFGERVAVLHSALSDGERYDEWHRIRSGVARVVVGPRSAIWAPVRNLGLIVVDEEHEASYKQDEMPRYHARDVAVLRGKLEGARVVLGSATPSLESWLNVKKGKYELATIAHRAGKGSLPTVRLVERRTGPGSETDVRGSIFSTELLEALRVRLNRGEQAILFLNRRGYSRSVVCEACGAAVTCPNCGVPYTYHRADSCLRCHVCGGWIPRPAKCPVCGCIHLTDRGVGTQRAEAALHKCFPRASVLRMDADTTSRRSSHDDILGAFARHEADILIGTQMIAKGLDFPNVTLVGVLNADSSLNMAGSDFRASERTFQLLAQVSGRAGRAELPGEVIIQCRDARVQVLRDAARCDFVTFAESELALREQMDFPPFSHLAIILLRSKDLRLASDWASMYAASLANFAARQQGSPLMVGEAFPSVLEKVDGWYRWQIVLRSASAASITAAWRWISSVRPPPKNLHIHLDLDAHNLV